MKLLFNAFFKFICGFIIIALLLFLSAGSINFFNGWLFLSIPIILGSWWSFACFVPYIAVVAVRILNEEKLLEQKLEGYVEYKKKVKYRLIPFIW